MSKYLVWKQQVITDFSPKNITTQYDNGFVFTRMSKGAMDQTRSLRVHLKKLKFSSENKRILRKTEHIAIESIPLPYANYHWSIGKLAKDFYTSKFGKGTFSANKVKELLTDDAKSNFNLLLQYYSDRYKKNNTTKEKNKKNEKDEEEYCICHTNDQTQDRRKRSHTCGYTICYANQDILHYSYPFYDTVDMNEHFANLGMGMMTRAIMWARGQGKQYMYLGSAQRPSDVYKFQFDTLEWFDGKKWNTDIKELKQILATK